MSSWQPKVNRHVTYFGTNRKPRPATITNVDSPTQLDLRVGRSGITLLNIVKETTANSPHYSSQTNVWRNI